MTSLDLDPADKDEDYYGSSEEEEEESDTEQQAAQRTVLPVADFDDYDPSVPPQSGVDYLRRVQLEARKEPKIKVANNLSVILKSSQNRLPSLGNGDNPTEKLNADEFICSRADFRLSESAISRVISLFERLRRSIDHLRLKHNYNTIEMHRSKEWWREFCLEPKEEQPEATDANYEPQLAYSTSLPRLSFLSQLDQNQICLLLKYHCHWLGEEFTLGNGLWIYSLLAALDTTQTGDVYNLIRQISRLCSQIRHRLEETVDLPQSSLQLLSSLNLIITLVGHYFGQRDLIDS